MDRPEGAVRSLPVCLFVLLACLPAGALARQEADTTLWRTASLVGWQERLHRAIRDRQHGYGGLFFDRGLYRRFTPQMDHEYDLDLLTYGFTLQEDYAWYRSPSGYRAYAGSINRSRFALENHLRATVPLGRHLLRVTGLQQEDLTAQRFFVEVGYAYAVAPGQQVGFTQTLASYKPDLDFSVFYTLGTLTEGLARAEVTALDAFNDLIFDGLGVDPVLEDTVRSYRRQPWLFALQLASPPLGRLRAELLAGVQTYARALVASQSMPAQQFFFEDQTNYQGGLLEYRHPAVTVGLVYQRTFSRMRRMAPLGSRQTSDYRSRQASRTGMLYVLGMLGPLRGEAWLSFDRYEDVQQGTDYDQATLPADLHYREHRLLARLRLRYVPPASGVQAGIEYLRSDRHYRSGEAVLQRSLLFEQWTPNHRLAVQAGYRFAPRVGFLLGVSFDLDGDPFYDDRGLTRYDGAYGRAEIVW